MILEELNPSVDLELLPVVQILQKLLRKHAETKAIITGGCKNHPAYFFSKHPFGNSVPEALRRSGRTRGVDFQ